MTEYMRITPAAKAAGVTIGSVYHYVRDGRLKPIDGVRPMMIDAVELKRLVDEWARRPPTQTKAERSAQRRAWAIANPDRVKASAEKHIAKVSEEVHRERARLRMAAWKTRNPDRARAIRQRFRQSSKYSSLRARRRIREQSTAVELVDRQIVWERGQGICHICGGWADPTDWHLDHKVPLARGGSHTYSNVGVSHPSCNHSKGAKVG